MSSRCRVLEWDSDFFGIRIGRVDGTTLRVDEVPAIRQWVAENKVSCLYFLARSDDDETVRAAEALGGHLVDLRVTLDRPAPALDERRRAVRSGRPSDIDPLLPVAESAYTDSRFFTDLRFPREKCRELYRIWLTRSFDDFANEVRVAVREERLAGFVTCKLDQAGDGEIGLVGVDASFRGRGVGREVTDDALQWFASKGVKTVRVPTQGRNIAAQRLYQSCGFRTSSIEIWYHCWFS